VTVGKRKVTRETERAAMNASGAAVTSWTNPRGLGWVSIDEEGLANDGGRVYDAARDRK